MPTAQQIQDRSPVQEIGKRTAETVPGLQAAAHAVGLEDHRRMLRDNASRVRDGHRAMMLAAGFNPRQLGASDEADDADMGGIVVTGDITYSGVMPPAMQQQMQSQPAPAVAGGLPGWVKSGLVATGMVGSALGGALLPGLMGGSSQPPAAQQPSEPPKYTDTNTNYELQIIKDDEPKEKP